MILRGWVLRNEIIWYKPACIPSSVRDRFTVDFEKVFFFTKSQRYYFEQQFEPYAESTFGRYRRARTLNGKSAGYRRLNGIGMQRTTDPRGRNMRCVWRIPYEPSHEAHYAMYPSRLVETPIKAGCPAKWSRSRSLYGQRNDGRRRPTIRTPLHRLRTQ